MLPWTDWPFAASFDAETAGTPNTQKLKRLGVPKRDCCGVGNMGQVKRLLLCMTLIASAASAGASGFENSGIGTSARGMGGAFRAVANDWTAAFYNPAGYGFIVGDQVGGNLALPHLRHELTPDVGNADGLGNRYDYGVYNDRTIYNLHEVLNNPSFGFVSRVPVWGETVIGFSAYEPFDYKIEWNLYSPLESYTDTLLDEIPNNQYLSDIDVYAFQFTAAREFIPKKLTIGVGLQLLRAELNWHDLTFRQNPIAGEVSDRPRDLIPEFSRNEGFGWGFGFTGGFLYKLSEKASVAGTFRVPFEITVDGDTELEYIMPKNGDLNRGFLPTEPGFLFTFGGTVDIGSQFSTTLKLPPSFATGISYQVSPKLLVALDLEYTLWSQFDGFQFDYTNYSYSLDLIDSVSGFFLSDLANPVDWKNAGKAMLGARYDWNSTVTLLGGLTADQSANGDGVVARPQFIDTGDKVGLNFGAQFHLSQWDLGFVTSYFDYPEQTINTDSDLNGDGITDSFTGTYRGSTYETVLSINYRF